MRYRGAREGCLCDWRCFIQCTYICITATTLYSFKTDYSYSSLAFQWICYIHRSNMSSMRSLAASVHRARWLISHGVNRRSFVSPRKIANAHGLYWSRKGGRERWQHETEKEEGEEEIYIARERDRGREGGKERVSGIDMHREYRMREPA